MSAGLHSNVVCLNADATCRRVGCLWEAETAAACHALFPCRWLSCQLVHTDSRHLAANLLLFLGLSALLETKYGSVRLAAVWLAAVVGGGLLSAATEDPCQLVGGTGGWGAGTEQQGPQQGGWYT